MESPLVRIPGDWYPAAIPGNVRWDALAHPGSSYCYTRFRSRVADAVVLETGATLCDGTTLEMGPEGRILVGPYAVVAGARIRCEQLVEIGAFAMIGWDAIVMDCYDAPRDLAHRRAYLRGTAGYAPVGEPVRIGRLAWVGFGSCVLPGVTIGEGAIVGAKSVVTGDVQPYTLVAGNPAREMRKLEPPRV